MTAPCACGAARVEVGALVGGPLRGTCVQVCGGEGGGARVKPRLRRAVQGVVKRVFPARELGALLGAAAHPPAATRLLAVLVNGACAGACVMGG